MHPPHQDAVRASDVSDLPDYFASPEQTLACYKGLQLVGCFKHVKERKCNDCALQHNTTLIPIGCEFNNVKALCKEFTWGPNGRPPPSLPPFPPPFPPPSLPWDEANEYLWIEEERALVAVTNDIWGVSKSGHAK